jgi:ubiquinone/menaquinone biosynthesis C-methylase UbiE
LAIELSRLGKYKITGMDISRTFIEIARHNAKEAKADITFQQGDVANIIYPDNSFDFTICTSAFKNFNDPVKALNEMYRVLKPDGKAWIDDLRKDFTNGSIDNLVRNVMNAKGFPALFMKWSFKTFLRKAAYTKAQFENFASESKFSHYNIVEMPIEIELLFTK